MAKNKETVEMSQKVLLDSESEKTVEQFVNYDPSDDWICLTHDGNSITLTVENYRKLVELAERVLKEEN